MPCYGCGKEYAGEDWIEAIIPDLIWEKISPTKDEGGILCITCIAYRLKQAGYDKVPVWLCGTGPFRAMEGDPADNLDLLRTHK